MFNKCWQLLFIIRFSLSSADILGFQLQHVIKLQSIWLPELKEQARRKEKEEKDPSGSSIWAPASLPVVTTGEHSEMPTPNDKAWGSLGFSAELRCCGAYFRGRLGRGGISAPLDSNRRTQQHPPHGSASLSHCPGHSDPDHFPVCVTCWGSSERES